MRLVYCLFLLVGCALTGCSTTTIYIVRHAEKIDETDSTDLSPAGRLRAVALADTLAGQGIDSIFTTPYRRTRQTAEPLANRINVRPVNYAAGPATVIANRVGRMRNKNVLLVGHSNTILPVAAALGARPTRSKIESGDFDNLLVVCIRRGPFRKITRLSEKTYGPVTAP